MFLLKLVTYSVRNGKLNKFDAGMQPLPVAGELRKFMSTTLKPMMPQISLTECQSASSSCDWSMRLIRYLLWTANRMKFVLKMLMYGFARRLLVSHLNCRVSLWLPSLSPAMPTVPRNYLEPVNQDVHYLTIPTLYFLGFFLSLDFVRLVFLELIILISQSRLRIWIILSFFVDCKYLG